ncbi:MAG: CHRD domain-containing protein [Verrucomicrobia bacterium]|nr:CHRD domain-containing protein [Verrucomicrobiota bacterium]
MPGSGWANIVNLNPVADTFILSSAPDNNNGGTSGFAAGKDGSLGVRRGLIAFDVSTVPAGSTITEAVLQLTVINVPGLPANSTFSIHRLLAGWGEGNKVGGFPGNSGAPATAGEATWNSRLHGTAAWTPAGALGNAAAVASASTPVTTLGTYSWSGASVINDVQLWLDNPATNHGWLLVSQDEVTSRTAREFGSRELPSPGVLTVGYTPPPASNTPPVVAILSPTNGASFAAPALVTIQAAANDFDGSVTNVEFFDGAASLGSDPTGPDYSVMAALSPGGHTLTAVAKDNLGAATTSLPINVSVSNPIITDPIAERVPKGNFTIEVQTVADGMASPLGMAVPDDGSGRMLVHDQDGRVWIVTPAGRQTTPLLDVHDRLVTLGAYDERGLLGFAVHPNFAAHPLVYTYTSEPLSGTADFENGLGSTNNHHSVIAEWQISTTNANVVDVSTRREILRIDQPQPNHNGGAMHFGPDGYLYIVLGDGGQANDAGLGHVPGGNGQDSNNIWGTMIRIDVDGTNSANGQYGVPGDNPFVGGDGLDEIFAYGFRNPFSFSFDSLTGDILLGDVGQGKVEEVDVVTPGDNFGWNIKEGTFWFDGAGNIVAAPVRPVPPGLVDPIAMYDHDDGLAIIGGYRYRGGAIGGLAGTYVFGDWGSFSAPSGRLYYLDATNGVNEFRLGFEDRSLGMWLKGWGQDAGGELYVFGSKALGPSGATGRMLKLIPAPAPVEITGVAAAAAGNVQIDWTGGSGPFAAQRRNALGDPLWMDSMMTTGTVQTTVAGGASGFFRVSDVAHQPAIPFSAYLAGDFQNPPVVTGAGGLGLFSLDGNTLTFSVNYSGLTGPWTVAHIHGPAGVGTNGGVLINLAPYADPANGTEGTFSGVIVLSDAQKAQVLAGLTYVNVHTGANPGGEIRGQIAPVLMQVDLNGANERPTPVNTPGRGLGTLTLVGNTLNLNLTYSGLTTSASASHIHGPATMDGFAGVLVNLAGNVDGSFGTSGSLSGPVVLTPSQLGHVINGQTYINIHTGTNPGGEIRGQILAKPSAVPLSAWLSGLAERPTPVTNAAAGSATFLLEGQRLTFNVQYESLSGTAIGAHIHGPAAASGSAAVLVDLSPFNGTGFGSSGTLSGSVILTPDQRNQLLGGLTYVNVHTTANPGGELRGQIAPALMMAHLSGINERPTPNASPGTGLGVLALAGNTLSFVVAYGDLTGVATGAHIHGPGSLFGTAGVLIDLGPFNGGAFGNSGFLSGSTALPSDPIGYLVDGLTYINLHTAANPNGEIRGQIQR